MKSYYQKLAVTALLILAPLTSFADSIRCGPYIIQDGMGQNTSKYEVLKKCGEPDIREGNTWIYESSTKLKRTITFDGSGLISRIQTGD
jgi:hypothetical protein